MREKNKAVGLVQGDQLLHTISPQIKNKDT